MNERVTKKVDRQAMLQTSRGESAAVYVVADFDDGSQALIGFSADGMMTVALRKDPHASWGPPSERTRTLEGEPR